MKLSERLDRIEKFAKELDERTTHDSSRVRLAANNTEKDLIMSKNILLEYLIEPEPKTFLEPQDRFWLEPVESVNELPPPDFINEGSTSYVREDNKIYRMLNGGWSPAP